MADKRQIEVFSAGCSVCNHAVAKINEIACPWFEVTVLDMNNAAVAGRAKSLGVQSVPTVAINGVLADCCSGRGINEDTLLPTGLGQRLS